MTEPSWDLVLIVPGKPRTQGSLGLWRAADGTERARHSDETKNHRNLLVERAQQAWGDKPPLEGPVLVSIVAVFARPKGHFGTGRNASVLKPGAPQVPTSRGAGDLDKIARLVLDGLDVAGVYLDDSQVAMLQSWKVYGERPETRVRVRGGAV
jgi:Holliday junction resolvase RusA-like endonuclease